MMGEVWLVGAGPGDEGLITVKGLDVLKRADVVVYDRLVGPELLARAPARARMIDAGKSPKRHTLTQSQIEDTLVSEARQGALVVRLKGGDPFVYGRGWEEVEACRKAGIPCHVVPGITSAVGVPTHAGVPLTMRGQASSVAVVTPRAGDGFPHRELPYEALAQIDTVVVMMGRAGLADVAAGLIRGGKAPGTPVSVIQDGTLPSERRLTATLETVASEADREGFRAPVLVTVGAGAGVVGDRAATNQVARPETPTGGAPANKRPLEGRRVLMTRPRGASGGMLARLSEFGAEVIRVPLIRVEYLDPSEWYAPGDFDWTVFTSFHGVRAFARQMERRGMDLRCLGTTRVAAIGPMTARAVTEIGVTPALVPTEYRAHALVSELSEQLSSGDRVLFPCGTLALDTVVEGLAGSGASLQQFRVYDTLPVYPDAAARAEIRAGIDAVLLYSPSAARAMAESGVALGDAQVISVGPATAVAAELAGLRVDAVPGVYGDEGVLKCVLELLGRTEVLV